MNQIPMKHCKRCDTTKPMADFHRDSKSKDGHYSYCKECNKAKTRDWNARPENKAKAEERTRQRRQENPDVWRNMQYKKKYGITIDDYNKMLEDQGGVCAICAQPERRQETANLAVDHCHVTGKIRGLLCSNCNRAIGLMADDPERFVSAASYLTQPGEPTKSTGLR